MMGRLLGALFFRARPAVMTLSAHLERSVALGATFTAHRVAGSDTGPRERVVAALLGIRCIGPCSAWGTRSAAAATSTGAPPPP
ncbi:hypothetical protein ACFV0H_17355 [Streptomyces erythrochromogenes]|uniref:hypothetical protein n=1 Tax=Streptomyces erythrochromogenes TaxID=285574 RepID=UPI00367CE862